MRLLSTIIIFISCSTAIHAQQTSHVSRLQKIFGRHRIVAATDGSVSKPGAYISVFPNPSTGKFNLFPVNFKEEATMIVTDRMCRRLYTRRIDFNEVQSFTLDLTNYPKGLYFMRLITSVMDPQVTQLITVTVL